MILYFYTQCTPANWIHLLMVIIWRLTNTIWVKLWPKYNPSFRFIFLLKVYIVIVGLKLQFDKITWLKCSIPSIILNNSISLKFVVTTSPNISIKFGKYCPDITHQMSNHTHCPTSEKSIETFDYFTAEIHTLSRHYSRQLIPNRFLAVPWWQVHKALPLSSTPSPISD